MIRNISLTSKFITSQPGLQTIAIHILSNISQSKGNQTMKLGQLIQYSRGNIFLQKLFRKWGRETSSRPLFIFSKNLIWGKAKQVVYSLVSTYFDSPQIFIQKKTNCIKLYTINPEILILILIFQKGLSERAFSCQKLSKTWECAFKQIKNNVFVSITLKINLQSL